MMLLEIVLPDMGKRMFVSVNSKTLLKEIGGRLCSVIDPKGESALEEYRFVNIDEMRIPDYQMTVNEAGLVNGSRMIFIKNADG